MASTCRTLSLKCADWNVTRFLCAPQHYHPGIQTFLQMGSGVWILPQWQANTSQHKFFMVALQVSVSQCSWLIDACLRPPLAFHFFTIPFCLSLSIFYSLCSDEMQRDCELGIKECSLRMRDEKTRVIKWERSVGLLVWCPEMMYRTREAKEDRTEREKDSAGS